MRPVEISIILLRNIRFSQLLFGETHLRFTQRVASEGTGEENESGTSEGLETIEERPG